MKILFLSLLSAIYVSHCLAAESPQEKPVQMLLKIIINNDTVTGISNVNASLGPKSQNEASFFSAFYSSLKKNKFSILIGSIVTGYLALYIKLLCSAQIIHKSTNWASWYDFLTIDQLQNMQQQQLMHDLLDAIKKRYYRTNEQQNALISLTYFINDVEKEIIYRKKFIMLHTWIKQLKLGFLFPAQVHTLEQAQQHIARLNFFKSLVLTWIGEHSIHPASIIVTSATGA